MKIVQYFTSESQLREHLSADIVKHEFIATSLSDNNRRIANSLLLDPDYQHDNPQLQCSTLQMSAETAVKEAERVANPLLAHQLRRESPIEHRIPLYDESKPTVDLNGREISLVVVTTSRYIVPVAYRVVGLVHNEQNNNDLTLFAVRVVFETHRLTLVEGTFQIGDDGKLNEFDSILATAIRTYENKPSERLGEPLPIARALAAIVMQYRKLSNTDLSVNAILSSDQVLVKIECVELVDNDSSDSSSDDEDNNSRPLVSSSQMMRALQSALQNLGVSENGSDDSSMPPLVKDSYYR